MSRLRIAKGGSAADPPHLGHLALVEALLNCGLYDYVIWSPSGYRNDKKISTSSIDRDAMTHLTFSRQWLYEGSTLLMIDSSNVYRCDTPTITSLEKLAGEYPSAEISWYTGTDVLVLKEELGGHAEIELWYRGRDLIKKYGLLIIPRVGCPIPENLPPNSKILDVVLPDISSSQIRELIKTGQSFEHLVTDGVYKYIKRRGLYGYER